MEQLKAKLKKQGGFTMVELLIVVAIIAILVAVSIPMMNNALESSREAVDQANERDARSLAIAAFLTKETTDADYVGISKGTGGSAYYSVEADGTAALVKDKPSNGYGQGTSAGAVGDVRTDLVIKVTVTPDATAASGVKVETVWE